MQWPRPADQVLLRLAVAYLIAMPLIVILAIFVSPWWGLVATAVAIGYGALMLRVAMADKPAYPDDRLPWQLEVLFHGWADKGAGITIATWSLVSLLSLLLAIVLSALIDR